MKRHPTHVVMAKLRRGEKLFRLDYGHYKFEDGTRPGEGVIPRLLRAGVVEVVTHGSMIDAEVVIAKGKTNE